MLPDFEIRLRAMARVIVRVGLNLQHGQRLLIAEPYELQGVARSAEVLVVAVEAAAREAGGTGCEVIWGDGASLRHYAEKKDWRGFAKEAGDHARAMQDAILNGDALLFLPSSHPHLMDHIPSRRVSDLRQFGWEHFGPIAQQLTARATNWSVAPAPIPTWAHAVYHDLPSEQRLAALWTEVFSALRIPARVAADDDAVAGWHVHLAALQRRRDELNQRRHTRLRYVGPGTDLAVSLPPGHSWCTAVLESKAGIPFVANLPTEEVFTAPDKDSASGVLRVARPLAYGGSVIEGAELAFEGGRVVRSSARQGADLLQRLLETDTGSGRLGEVALVPGTTSLAQAGRSFGHALLDENASHHVALGEAYPFCHRDAHPSELNRSLLHVDLPLEARVELS